MSIKKPTFDPSITWGHILQLIVVMAGLCGLYADARVYKAQTAARIERLEEHDKEHRQTVSTIVMNTQRLNEVVTRLTVMMDAEPPRTFRDHKRGAMERN